MAMENTIDSYGFLDDMFGTVVESNQYQEQHENRDEEEEGVDRMDLDFDYYPSTSGVRHQQRNTMTEAADYQVIERSEYYNRADYNVQSQVVSSKAAVTNSEIPHYVWEDDETASTHLMEVVDGGRIIQTQDKQQDAYLNSAGEVIEVVDEGHIDRAMELLIEQTDGDVNDFFISTEPVRKKEPIPRLLPGDSTWVNPDDETFICMWKECGCKHIVGRENLTKHIDSHIETYSKETEEQSKQYKCSIIGCIFETFIKGAIGNHVAMHLHHATQQMEALQYMKKSEELRHVKTCGFRPVLHLTYDGMEMNCHWEYCDRSFEHVSILYDHLAEHVNFSERGDKIFNRYHCGWGGCEKQFDHRGDLRKHANRHVNMKKCACPYCGAFMNSWEKLGLHLTRRGEKHEEFECKKCMKRFANEAILQRHLRAHLYKFDCKHCGMLFCNKYEIERHTQKKHSNKPNVVKMYRCDYKNCGEIFDSSSKLTSHKTEHSIAQFNCKHCSCKFIYQVHLNFHKMKHHPNTAARQTVYECHLCMKTMDSSGKLSYHLKKIHHLQAPEGFHRFTYKKCSDDIFRVCTMKLTVDSLED